MNLSQEIKVVDKFIRKDPIEDYRYVLFLKVINKYGHYTYISFTDMSYKSARRYFKKVWDHEYLRDMSDEYQDKESLMEVHYDLWVYPISNFNLRTRSLLNLLPKDFREKIQTEVNSL